MKQIPPYVVTAALALVVLIAGPSARGQDQDSHGLRQEVQALKAQVATLISQNAALQSQINGLQTQLTNAQNVLALAPFVSVDPNPQIGVAGPNITFKGANIHIVSGSGSTNDYGDPRPTGLGNLIIGYDESPVDVFRNGPGLNSGDRGGSHNLVIGRGNRFTQAAFGGIVAGEVNTISNRANTVLGGLFNAADGIWASVTGGSNNTASGEYVSVTGGSFNTASGSGASVSGGSGNTASGDQASVLGGASNTASGSAASVLGGLQTTAAGQTAVVLGGFNFIDNNNNSIAPGAPLNFP